MCELERTSELQIYHSTNEETEAKRTDTSTQVQSEELNFPDLSPVLFS